MWKLINDSSNYLSVCGKYIAVYKHGYGGLALYWIFKVSQKERNQRKAVAVGGLLSNAQLERLGN